MKFDVAAATSPGPRSINEDEVGWWSPLEGTVVAAVADGLGGMGGGGVASHMALATLRRLIHAHSVDEFVLMKASQQAHLDILEAQRRAPQLRRMATTLTAGIFFPIN